MAVQDTTTGVDVEAVLFTQEAADDPHAGYRTLLERCPVARAEGFGGEPAVYISGYEDVLWALRHPEVFASAGAMELGEQPLIPLQVDPPRHTKYRRLLNPEFVPRKVAELEPDVRVLVSSIIDEFVDEARPDLRPRLEAFARSHADRLVLAGKVQVVVGGEAVKNDIHILERMLKQVRETLAELRPRPIGPEGLMGDLRNQAEEFARLYSIRVEISSNGTEELLPPPQREVVYQVVREALTNVRRHSGSSICRVRMAFAARPFMIEVADEGRGLTSARSGGYGLVGMRERAAGIGGRLEVVSTEGRGTTVFLFGPN